MKRIQEKVKDLIEVHAYKSLQDFISEPSQTLAIYRFTDFTSDLMVKYLDKIAAVGGKTGAATALAGYRGVGKSHLLATLGALVSHPELRSKVSEARVAASLQSLKRTRYPVGYVRRGSGETLFAELKDAVAKAFDLNAAELKDSLPELLSFAAEKAGELPFVLIVDTASERVSRVARDDGVLLGEIAEQVKRLNFFVVVALDDDIADADGINAAIARNFTIDYLDQEHLYRIVDAHLFPKIRQMQPKLHEIYTDFREALPGFRWSEQRFAALYPLHPIILEIAPFVRLYAPEFALLGFAADAGAKILARPANSLIGLDEVFDSVESSLRKAADLAEAFAAFDNINKSFIAQISIMQRLQAKLVLKALFLLSLEGEGATAAEIGAAMMIGDDGEPGKSIQIVGGLLENFAANFPAEVQRATVEDRDTRYNLKVGSKDNLTSALNEAVKSVSPAVIPKILRRAAREKFADWTFDEADSGQNADSLDCAIVWRGSLRRGRLVWGLENEPAAEKRTSPDSADWEIIISREPPTAFPLKDSNAASKVYWQPAHLRDDETEAILRYYVLRSNNSLREEYGEQTRAAAHSLILVVEKIWDRIFLQEARIFVDRFDYGLSDEARNSATLSEMLSKLLEPLFEAEYPDHPYFTQTLGAPEVASLIGDFFSGARQNLAEIQRLAETFALPLGLVAFVGNSYVAESEEHLANLSLTERVLKLVGENPEQTVSLKKVSEKLKKSPYGLVNEAQHLILTALVAQRQIEFVTSNGDRINRRSLDLKIIWDDIEGVAKPSSVIYSNERLTEWARILTASDVFGSINQIDERALVRASLENWLADWKSAGVLERFDRLPDDILNTKIWRLAVHAEKTFGAVAAAAAAIVEDSISVEEGLHRIADAFGDSEKEFFAGTKDLVVLEDFINGVATRLKIKNYLTLCENTPDETIENCREKLSAVAEQSYLNPNEILNREMEELWKNFHEKFAAYFASEHDAALKSPQLKTRFDEILGGDGWWEFETLSRLPVFDKKYWNEAGSIRRRLTELDCRFEVREMLEIHPFCACSFNLTKSREWANLPAALERTIDRGRRNYMETLRLMGQTLILLIEQFAENNDEKEFAEAATHLTQILKSDGDHAPLTNNELIILQKTIEVLPAVQLDDSSVALSGS
ncbi:MAG TPA: DUF6079 family protein [Pyrinomonadaceae bacterium]|nr:DUF6079 family protein [Pyrinomonadaceae bacterium]